jgi:hypothetical protein
VNINFEDVPAKYQMSEERLSAALGRPVNLHHEPLSNITLELLTKVEQYQVEYQDTVKAIRDHMVKEKSRVGR